MGCGVSGAAFSKAMGAVTSGLDYRAVLTYVHDCLVFGSSFEWLI